MQAKFAKPPLPIKKPIPPNKRKDLGKVFLPTEFQIKAPFKILKTNIIKTQPPPKLKKPKILWKTLNKFTIKPKFIEFINYLRAICKNITNSLKESSIISQFLLNGKEEYLNAYEKLKALIDKFKHQKNSNLSILNEAKQQTMFLQSETKNLHHKLEEIKRLTIELKLKIQDKTIEKNQLSQENIIISQKHQELFENSSNIKKDVLDFENKIHSSEARISQINMDIEKEQMLIKGLESKVTKKQEAIHGKSVSLGFIDRSFSLFLPKKPASKN